MSVNPGKALVNAPVNAGKAPVNSGNAPVNSGNAPVNSGNAPVNPGNAPVIPPVNSGKASVNPGNAPVNSGKASVNPGNASKVPACRTVNIYNTRENPMNNPKNLNVSDCDIIKISDNKEFQDSAEKVIELFKGNNDRGQWVNNEGIPPILVNLTNLIDMSYNFMSGEKNHIKHFKDVESVRQSTPGFVACHMFVEYLCKMNRAKNYIDALEKIKVFDFNPVDKYIGQSYANSTWREAAIYRDACGRGDWLKTFSHIYEKEPETLFKEAVQLRMCAFLLLTYLNPENSKNIDLIELIPTLEDGVDERLLTIENFPVFFRNFVTELKNSIQKGGRKAKKTKASKSKKPVPKNKKQSGGCGGGMCGPVATNKRVMVGGKNRIVYSGKRGGEYVKSAGEFIPLNKLKNLN